MQVEEMLGIASSACKLRVAISLRSNSRATRQLSPVALARVKSSSTIEWRKVTWSKMTRAAQLKTRTAPQVSRMININFCFIESLRKANIKGLLVIESL